MFRFEVEVLKYNIYDDKIVSTTPASILAENQNEVTEKVRAASSATYDNFRKLWSHGWQLKSFSEVPAPTDTDEKGGSHD